MSPSANGKAQPDSATTFIADTIKSTNEQMITTVKQVTTMTLDAASATLDSLSKLAPSLPSLPTLPLMPSKTSIVQLMNVGFDASESLLSMQRGLATDLVERFAKVGAS